MSCSALETYRRTCTRTSGNNMLHASGEFDDQSYKAASDAIDTGLARAAAERKDVESIYSYLSKPDGTSPSPSPIAAPVQTPVPTPTPQTPARDQVIALHVRET